MLQVQDLRDHVVLILLLFHVYFETRPETLGHLIELDRQSKPLIIETEQFVKNTKIIKFQAYERWFDAFTDWCRRLPRSNKISAEMQRSFYTDWVWFPFCGEVKRVKDSFSSTFIFSFIIFHSNLICNELKKSSGKGWRLRHSFGKHVFPLPFPSGLLAEKHTSLKCQTGKTNLIGDNKPLFTSLLIKIP